MFASVGVVYLAFADHLPPRTPQKVARLLSGLPVSRNSEVIRFTDEWISFNGDGIAHVEIVFDREEFRELVAAARRIGYQPYASKDGVDPLVESYVGKDSEGFYRLKRDHGGGYTLSVLEDRTLRLIAVIEVL